MESLRGWVESLWGEVEGFVGWGGECVTPVLVRSQKLSTLVHSQ